MATTRSTSHSPIDVPATQSPRYVRQGELLRMLGISRPTLYLWRTRKDDPFPRAVRLSPRTIAWRIEDVQAWLNARPAA